MSGAAGTDQVTVADLVEAQVVRRPQALAVAAGDRGLTYADLDGRANGLARRLQDLGVGRDVPVAVFVERSLAMTVALLAVLKAGGACVPLDPTSPPDRVDYLLRDSETPVVVTHDRLVARLPATDARVVCLGAGDADGRRPLAPLRETGPEDVAFLLYTSGSTGRPKGVMLTHRGLVNHHRAVAGLYDLGPDDRVLQFCSMSFDVSIEEIFPTWVSGATVVLRDEAVPILGRSWLDWLRRERITVLNLPTAYWHEWVRDLETIGQQVPDAVRLVTVGGEKASGGAYRTWMEVGGGRVRWLNAYGPTEATIGATFFEPAPGTDARGWTDPPIGRPIANTTAHVLDATGAPVAAGERGELHIGGVGLARGYWKRPELSAERFVPDPFSDRPGARLYRTGDIVRLLGDGNLDFVGRVDQQVKVRGFRIECGEVEAALAEHPDVGAAVVVAREDSPGRRRLVAYAAPAPGARLSGPELRRFLTARLPRYMVPTAFVVLDSLPQTPGGKLDRQRLPPPANVASPSGVPTTATEEALAAIWAPVLGVDSVGVDDDFFDLGGHSLTATQVIARAREAFGVDVALQAIFEAPTIRALGAIIDAEGASGPALPPLLATPRPPDDHIPLSLAQAQMWRLEAEASPPGLYNITVLHRFAGTVDAALVRQALEFLVDRHESLRTSFGTDSDGVFQTVAPAAPVAIEVTDIRATPAADQELELERRVAAWDDQAIGLGRPPLFRACLVLAGDGAVLVVTFDHMICDGTSAYIFLSELGDVYAALAAGRAPRLAPLPVQYPDYARWQRRWLTEERQRVQLEYWKRRLRGMPRGPAVPFDTVPVAPTRRIRSRELSVTDAAYRALRALASETRSTMFVVVAAAVQSALCLVGGATDVVLSTTLSGRQRAELEGVIGFFAGIGRIRTDLASDPTFGQVVARTRESVLGLFDHQDVPFLKVRDAVFADLPDRGAAVHPLAALPVELQYFHAGADGWAPGLGVIERRGAEKGPDELFFRGQLHPLSITLLDNGAQLWGEVNYKVDFYRPPTIKRLATGLERLLEVAASAPERRLSQLRPTVEEPVGDGLSPAHRPVGSWRLDA